MMIEGPDSLRQWLTATLKPICDAEPGALAKYVMALLKKDKSEQELKDFCIDQLDVFLQKETKTFVDRLFEVVQDKSYLPTAVVIKRENEPLKPSQPSSINRSNIDDGAVSSTTLVPGHYDNTARSPGMDRSRGIRKPIEAPPRDEKLPREREREKRDMRDHKRDSWSRSTSRERERVNRGRPGVYNRTGRSTRSDRDTRRRSKSRSRERERRVQPKESKIKVEVEPPGISSVEVDSTVTSSNGVSTEGKDIVPSTNPKGRKPRCRDYDEKGYCMRGDRCQFDHGPDPVVVDGPDLAGMITGGSTLPGTTTQTTVNASTMVAPLPNFSVPPPGYTPLNPPPPGVDAAYVPQNASTAPAMSVATSEAYNPEAPAIESSPLSVPPPDITQPPPPLPNVIRGPWPPPNQYNQTIRPDGNKRHLITVTGEEQPFNESMMMPIAAKRGRGNIGARLGPSRFPHRPFFNRGQQRTDNINKTLQVRRIPSNLNNIAKLNEHFGQFGQLTNIQVCYDGDPEAAVITFANRYQAQSAYRSTEPILNNRFIKMFWHGGEEQSATGVKARLGPKPENEIKQEDTEGNNVSYSNKGLSKTIVNQNAFSRSNVSQMSVQSVPTPVVPSVSIPAESYVALRKRRKLEKEKKMAYMDLHKKKSALLSKQLEQQKMVIKQLEKCKNEKQKKELMMMFKQIDSSLKSMKSELEDVTKKLSALDAASQTANERARTISASRTKEQVEKEKLDIELEMMNQQQSGGETADLKRRLIELKDELLNIENHKTTSGPATSTPIQSAMERRPSTGNKKRGLIPNTAKLDKRPRNLAVTGFKQDEKDAIITHLQQFGDLEDLEFDKDKEQNPRALVTYKTRGDAEEALSLAPDFNECTITVRWASQTQSGLAANSSRESHSSVSVVPDTNRQPSDQVTAVQLLASLGDDDISDDSDKDMLDDDAFDYEDDEDDDE